MQRRRVLRTLTVAALAGIAGCLGGDDEEETPTATPRPTGTPRQTASPTATAESTDAPAPSPEPTDSPTPSGTPTATPTPTPEADLTVTVGPEGRLVFDPKTFEVAVGETVRWVWDSPGHNVSPERQPSDASWPGDDGTTFGSGHTYAYTFAVPGSYEYHCDPHQSVGMRGSFAVR